MIESDDDQGRKTDVRVSTEKKGRWIQRRAAVLGSCEGNGDGEAGQQRRRDDGPRRRPTRDAARGEARRVGAARILGRFGRRILFVDEAARDGPAVFFPPSPTHEGQDRRRHIIAPLRAAPSRRRFDRPGSDGLEGRAWGGCSFLLPSFQTTIRATRSSHRRGLAPTGGEHRTAQRLRPLRSIFAGRSAGVRSHQTSPRLQAIRRRCFGRGGEFGS